MVATVHELASSATAVSYYEKDGYYARNDPEHRKASFWHGRAAADLGLRGHVVPSRFESVLSGQVPKSDIRLGRIVDGKRQHRPGWDITFSAPKSVSLEALVTGDARVIRAHDEAVRATLDWIDRDLLQTRGWDPATKRRPRVKADGMVVAGFRHLTSRDLDPQLHTHCVLANMTRTPDGAWKSVEPTLLKRNEKLIGAHYRKNWVAAVAQGFAVEPQGYRFRCRVSSWRATTGRSWTPSPGAAGRSWRISRSMACRIRGRRRRRRRSTRAGARWRRVWRSWCRSGAPAPGPWDLPATRRP